MALGSNTEWSETILCFLFSGAVIKNLKGLQKEVLVISESWRAHYKNYIQAVMFLKF